MYFIRIQYTKDRKLKPRVLILQALTTICTDTKHEDLIYIL